MMNASLFVEGYRLMRERFGVYALFAAGCAVAAWYVMPRIDLYDTIANHPMSLASTPPVSIVLALAVVALFFILPSAMRRIEPNFRMTGIRIALTITTLLFVGIATELGYALAVIPGVIVAVLLSQSLVGALLRVRAEAGPRDLLPAVLDSIRNSVALTRRNFATTFGVIVASLAILFVPFSFVMLTLIVLGVKVPPSLVIMTPLLFLTFTYFECVRYALIVRWYRRLAGMPSVA